MINLRAVHKRSLTFKMQKNYGSFNYFIKAYSRRIQVKPGYVRHHGSCKLIENRDITLI